MDLTRSEEKLIQTLRNTKNNIYEEQILMIKIIPPGIYQFQKCNPILLHNTIPTMLTLIDDLKEDYNQEKTFVVKYDPYGTALLYDSQTLFKANI